METPQGIPNAPGGGEARRLVPFHPLTGEIPPRDIQDLMSYPFFSLAKGPRMEPIRYRVGPVSLRVDANATYGMATIWDADVLIWVASHIVAARDARVHTSRLIAATPHEILRYIHRGTSMRDYQRLRAALNRLQSTAVSTSLRQPPGRDRTHFSWLNEWRERVDPVGRPLGFELLLPDWLYNGLMDPKTVLRIDPAYFGLTGGIERWLYRLVRKHAGQQPAGWQFDFRHLYRKSGSMARFSDFASDVRRIARSGAIPGYVLTLERTERGAEALSFRPAQRGLDAMLSDLAERLKMRG